MYFGGGNGLELEEEMFVHCWHWERKVHESKRLRTQGGRKQRIVIV